MRNSIQSFTRSARKIAFPNYRTPDENRHSYGEFCYLRSSAMQYEDVAIWKRHVDDVKLPQEIVVSSVDSIGLKFGSNQSQVKNLLGKPRYAYKLATTRNHTIYYYFFNTPEFGSYTTELHFYNDYLFLIKHLVDECSGGRDLWLNLLKKKFNVILIDEDVVLNDQYGRTFQVVDNVVTEFRFMDVAFVESYYEIIAKRRGAVNKEHHDYLLTQLLQPA